MADILDEVINDAKDEKLFALFRKFFPIVIFLAIGIASFMATYNWYYGYVERKNKETGDIFFELLTNNYSDQELLMNSLKKITDDNTNKQASLAAVKQAAIYAETDLETALSKLDLIINNNHYPEVTTAYARILWLNLVLDNEISDEQKPKLLEYMEYFDNADKPFYAMGSLLKAFIYAKTSQKNLAKELLVKLLTQEKNIPPVIKEQAQALFTSLEY